MTTSDFFFNFFCFSLASIAHSFIRSLTHSLTLSFHSGIQLSVWRLLFLLPCFVIFFVNFLLRFCTRTNKNCRMRREEKRTEGRKRNDKTNVEKINKCTHKIHKHHLKHVISAYQINAQHRKTELTNKIVFDLFEKRRRRRTKDKRHVCNMNKLK